VIDVAIAGQRVGLPAQAAELVEVHHIRVDVEFVAPGPAYEADALPHGLPQCGP